MNYSYNLANELTSLSLPSWSQAVGYNYDSAGRLNAVSASGFSTSTYNWQTGQTTYTPLANFASNFTYRAWGGIKRINYGNGAQLNQQYNPRLQASNADYTQAGVTRPTSYDYYADGRVHHAYDSNVNLYDRAYEYDHVGRLKQAYSGAQARGGTTNDGPYLQSYGYDAFGNLTNRTNYFWAHLLPGDTAAYTNNRRPDYSYDAAANILDDSNDHTYDAAGNQTGSTTTYVSALTTVYLTQTYDGDGRPAMRTEHRVIEQESGPPDEEWAGNYFLRSSVLNGAPIVDLSGFGKKLLVYAAGTVLAEEGNMIVGQVQWRYPKPATGSWMESNGNRQEMDPMGADVTENPYQLYQSPSYLNLKEGGERLFDEGDDPFSVGSGCSLDGMPVSCSYLNRRLDDGSVQTQYGGLYERDPNLPAGAPGRFVPVTRDIRNHGLGIYEIWMPPEFRNEYSMGGRVLITQSSALADRAAKNCATPNSIVAQFKKDFEAQWKRTTESGEENGTLIFYEQSKNAYPTVTLSEGRHMKEGLGIIPSMPEIGPETGKAIDDFLRAKRSVYLLAYFHTHPNYPNGESRSGNPSWDDIQYQSNNRNALGIIRTDKGYSFFSNGRTFLPDDPRANECVWTLNHRRD